METKKYVISVDGCDDYTKIIKELTIEEYELLKEVSTEITNTSKYGCMPTMQTVEYVEED